MSSLDRKWSPDDRWGLSDRLKAYKNQFVKLTWRELAESMGVGETQLGGLVHGGSASDESCDKIQAWFDR